MSLDTSKFVVYRDVADDIPNAALLLWRPTTWVGWLIARLDRSSYSHVGTVKRDVLVNWSMEFLQFQGGVQKPLSEYVEKYPGKIDVYDCSHMTPTERSAICGQMEQLILKYPQYGWLNLWKASRWYLPGIRLFGTLDTDDAEVCTGAPHCSMARALAERRAGIDSVRRTPPHGTTPGDFGRCPWYKYLYTLYHTDDQIRQLWEAV